MITKNYIAKGEGANRFEKVPVRIYEKPSEAVKADRKSTRLNSSHWNKSRMPSSA